MTPRHQQNTTEQTQPLSSLTPSRYQPEDVERILAQANDLQDAHQQTLDEAQIHAVAAEVGIGPEFVRAALEQEKQRSVPLSRGVQQSENNGNANSLSARQVAAAIVAYGVFAAPVMGLGRSSPHFELVYLFAFVLPALLALTLGATGESRKRGSLAGGGLAATVVAAVCFGVRLSGVGGTASAQDMEIFLLMFVTGAALGFIGAEARRQVRKFTQRRLRVSPR